MLHQVSFNDLEFESTPAVFHSTRGVPQFRSLKVGMPRIPDKVIKSVFYLYRSREDALAGRNPGGTGFVVSYEGTFETGRSLDPTGIGNHYYGVTNWHVACSNGFSTIRLNTKDGGTDVIELDPSEWHFIPGKYDVAVVPLSLSRNEHDVSAVSSFDFATNYQPLRGINSGDGIGVGDDVFMIGLFIDHAGITTNVPSARFGNISMLPSEKATIKQSTGLHGESYVVDMHSRTGFSGSPVYVYKTFGSDLSEDGIKFDELNIDQLNDGNYWSDKIDVRALKGRLTGRIRAEQMFKVLGIHWAQFPERWELRDRSLLDEANKNLIVEGGYVEGMSGMTCVIPAWHIMEVFLLPELKKLREPEANRAREAQRETMAKRRAMHEPKPESAAKSESAADASAPPSNDVNPNHREDFMRLVGAAARKPPQEG